MYNNDDVACVAPMPEQANEEGINQIVRTIADQTLKARELILSIQRELIGAQPCNEKKENDILCMRDSLKECRENAAANIVELNNILRAVCG